MKKLTLLIVTVACCFAYAQKTYTKSKLQNASNIELDGTYKITITNISEDEKDKYFVSHESDPSRSLKKGIQKKKGELFFDLSDQFKKDPQGLILVLPDGDKKSLIINSEVIKNVSSTAQPVDQEFTGIAFWDAKYIYSLAFTQGESESARSIINRYSGIKKDWPEIFKNPFFAKTDALRDLSVRKNSNGKGSIAKTESAGGGLSLGSLGGIDVTKYVQAFADFLRDRIKEELTIAYLERLKALIENTPELQYMLPKTRNVFLSNDAFSIPAMGATYKAAFAEDMEGLLPNFERMVYSLPKYQAVRNSEEFVGFMVAYHFADMSAKSYHPAEILINLHNRYPYNPGRAPVITHSIAVLDMFSRHMLDKDGKQWLPRNELKNISPDEIYIFLGLLYEKYTELFDVKVHDNKTFTTVLLDLLEKSETPFADKLYNFLVIANTIDERIKNFKGAADKPDVVLTYFINNADAVKDLLDFVLDLTNSQPINSFQYYKWKNVVELSLEAAKGIRENNLGKVGGNVIAITNEVIPGNEKWKQHLANIIKLITDLATAETSKDIKAILERSAAPVRSYRVARGYKHSSTIAAYPGLYTGYETNSGNSGTDAFAFGVTAPIGIAFHWGNVKAVNAKGLKQRGFGRSNSLFINLFDIGAALSYRWNNDTLDLPQKITLGQIFSPGIFYVNGWKKSPLAWKAGFQYAPQLRQIKNGANVISENAGVLRFTIGLSVDIPVFSLSGKEE